MAAPVIYSLLDFARRFHTRKNTLAHRIMHELRDTSYSPAFSHIKEDALRFLYAFREKCRGNGDRVLFSLGFRVNA